MRHLYVTLIALIFSFLFQKAYGQVVGPILGNPAMCSPSYMTYLSDTTTGGVWTISGGVATVSVSGIVTGVAPGTATVTYTVGSISSTLVVTVNAATPVITGIYAMCEGLSTGLTDAAGGGTWSSTNTIASVSSSGVVTGGSAPGTDTIIYTLGTGCSTSVAVTVNPDPPLPSGLTVCMGSTITLTDGVTGASWSSSNTGIATVTASFGTVTITGVSFGTATIYETLSTGCLSSTVVTVNTTPTAITGLTHICSGLCTTLNSLPAGGIWSGTGVVIAVGSISGVACAVATGISTVTYTIANGCFTTTVVTVNPNPGPIEGSMTVCVGLATVLTDATGGGTWADGCLAGVATISGGGAVEGVSAGTCVISYALGTGCIATTVVTVDAVAPAPIGPTSVCVGNTFTMSDAITPGTWSSSNTAIVSVGSTGTLFYANAPGTATITYTVFTGCVSNILVTVNPSPTAILGVLSVCAGSTTTLSDAIAGGTWSSSNTNVIFGSATGIATGVSAGTAIVTYETGTGCIAIAVMTVNPNASAGVGSPTLCLGGTDTLTGTVGGTWSVSNPLVVTFGLPAHLNGVGIGTSAVTYALSTGCFSVLEVTVSATTPGITGPSSVCEGFTIDLTDAATGGAWSSSNIAVGSVGASSGVVLGIVTGTTIISYTISGGCIATTEVTVAALSSILGVTGICSGGTTTLSDLTGGGIWSSSNSSIADIGSSTGVVTAISSGDVIISYTVGTGCSATTLVTVNTITPVLGNAGICVGGTTSLSDATGGGTWSSSNTVVATAGSSSGLVDGVSAGTTQISYIAASGCVTTIVVTVNNSVTPILGSASLCVGGVTEFSDATGGGTWSSGNTSIATVNLLTSVITGVSTGVATISYILSGGCAATIEVTVGVASPIFGNTSLCVGGTTSLSDATGSGTWSSSNTAIAAVGSTGVTMGYSMGTCSITYTAAAGCVMSVVVTVNNAPGAIGGIPGALCPGTTAALTDATSGGTWSSSNTGIATIGLASGVVVGGAVVTTVTCTITYTLPTGCTATAQITVNPSPAVILGPTSLCVGSGITLSDGTSGGTWSSSATGIATVGSLTGIVTGVSGGAGTISYQLSSGCYVTADVTVNAAPTISISAAPGDTVCNGTTVTYAATTGAITVGTYKWYVNGVLASGSSTFAYIPATGDVVTCKVIGTATCSSSTDSVNSSGVTMTVNGLPTITATSTGNCGGLYSLTGSGAGTGGTYVWAPTTGLSCTTCSGPTATVSSTVTYTVTGTDMNGCTNTYAINVDGNRISGFITMTTTPTDTVKVWLIQFNSTDSSLTAEDSTLSCIDGGTPYYEFDNEPAGNYMVKAMLLGGIAGTSGYIPTYGLSTAHWDTATHIVHVSATDTQHVNMIYGTVPSGPGFIGGLISSGAGRGTASSVPVAGMLVYLEDGSGNILTYTYTNTSGIYSFSGLAYNNYRVYPEDYQYHTTPWISITLNATSDSVASADFYQNTTNHTIIPGNNLHTTQIVTTTKINVYPNPAINELNVNWENEQTGTAHISIIDMTGRTVYETGLEMAATSGNALLDISNINNGIYVILIKSDNISYKGRLLIER